MEKTVFLHYTQAELDRNFDQRGWVKNALEIIGRYPELSKATRARFEHRTLAFGPGEDDTLDLFPAQATKAPVQIFVHGGAWRNFTKDDYSFPADAYVPAGVHTVVLNFTNVPKVRLPQMADQVRRGIEWVYRNAAGFGGDPERIYLSAHSSGAHLSALALQKDLRTAYSPELWAKLAARYADLPAADQLGLIYDSRALGETGVMPMGDFLALAKVAPVNADPIVLQALTDHLSAMDWIYEGKPGQKAYRAFAIARLAPIAARLGWDAKPGEADNDAVLRRAVLGALGELGDPATIAEARKRFAGWLTDPASLNGTGRRTVLAIVAANADEETWEQIHQKAKASYDPTDQTRLYSLLGQAQDKRLLDKALALALSGELKPTQTPALVAAVAQTDPDKAFDFAMANRAKLDGLLEPTSRASFYANLASSSRDPAMVAKLERFAATIPASNRGDVNKARASVTYRAGVVTKRVPEMDRWLAANSG